MSEEISRNCAKILKLLADYEVGSGSPGVRAEVEDHLNICPDCARELQALRRTSALLESAGAVSAPDSWDAIRSRLEPRPATSPGRGFVPWIVRHKLQTVAAAAAACVALGVAIIANINAPTEVDAQTYFANHAAMSWSDPFADRVALGLVSVVGARMELEATE